MAVMVTLYPYAFAQYQFGEDQSRIIFSSSNSTQATTPPSQSNPTISSNGYSNSTQATTPPSSNTIISSNGHPNSTQSIVIPPSTSAVPEFGSIAPVILVISLIVIVILNTKTRFFNLDHSGGI